MADLSQLKARVEHEFVSEPKVLTGHLAVVTGASGGVGSAIAVALARKGATIYAVGRNRDALDRTMTSVRRYSEGTACVIDVTVEDQVRELQSRVEEAGRADILVHSAGAFHQKLIADARVEQLDWLYAVNVRAPYLLTQRLLPLLIATRGQIVFINSSVALTSNRREIGQYAATKHALRGIADSLREEVSPKGVRVLSVYLGRTATAMQQAAMQAEGKEYLPERLLQPEEVASTVSQILVLPPTAEVTEISIRSMYKV